VVVAPRRDDGGARQHQPACDPGSSDFTIQIEDDSNGERLVQVKSVVVPASMLTNMAHSFKTPGPTLLDLPVELQVAISSRLTYPDALSLKHTNRHFYNQTYTGVNLKVEWLISRRELHLKCPHHTCRLNSDRDFCRGSIRLLMARRRQHGECETVPGGRGCLVFDTPCCKWKKTKTQSAWERIRRLMRAYDWISVGGYVVVLLIAIASTLLGNMYMSKQPRYDMESSKIT